MALLPYQGPGLTSGFDSGSLPCQIEYNIVSRTRAKHCPLEDKTRAIFPPDFASLDHWLLQGYRPQFDVNSIGQKAQVALSLHPRQRICYYPNLLHGGYQAFLLDHLFADCCHPAVTAELKVSYSRPIPPDSTLLLKVWPTKANGRKIYMSGSITPITQCQDKETPAVMAEALFILPKIL